MSVQIQITGKFPSSEEVKIVALAFAIDVWKHEHDTEQIENSSVRDAKISALASKFENYIRSN